ncbi:MAG: CHASE2 domain-containing protein [Alsobacter sp.]
MNGRVTGFLTGFVLMLAPLLIGMGAVLHGGPGVQSIRNLVFDGFQRLEPRISPPDAPVRVVDIDEESLKRIGQWPWPRDRIAQAVDRLNELGAAVVTLDIIFAEPDRTSPDQILAGWPEIRDQPVAMLLRGRSHDAILAASIGKAPSVIGFALSHDVSTPSPTTLGIAEIGVPARSFVPRFEGAVPPLPGLAAAASGLGAVNWIPDRDLVVRRVPLVFGVGEALVPSMALETLRVAQKATTLTLRATANGINALRVGELAIPTDGDGSVRVRYAGSGSARTIPFWRLLTPGGVERADIEGRIVLVGTSAAALGDIRATPLDASVPGVRVHAEVIEQILAGQHLVRPDFAEGIELSMLLLGALTAILLGRSLRPMSAALSALALGAMIWIAAWWAFSRSGFLLDPAIPSVAVGATYLIATVLGYMRTEGERRQIRAAFSHYVAPEIVRTISDNPGLLKLGGQTKPLTILFFDLRGFTARAESMPAENVIRFLNAVHTPLTQAVLDERGTIDKYIGDGLMAFWNAPLDVRDHAGHACRAALRMAETLPVIRAALAAEIGETEAPETIGLGIGVHTGLACVGNMGSTLRFDYSIVGDAVNTAARLEPLTKVYGVPILVSEDVADAVTGFAFATVDTLRLKGQARETRVLALLGPLDAGRPDLPLFIAAHERALDAVKAGKPDADALIGAAQGFGVLSAQMETTYAVWRGRLRAAVAASHADHERVVAGG